MINLIIDIGNTVAKLAAFDEQKLLEVVYDANDTLELLPAFCEKYTFKKAILATVIDLTEQVKQRLDTLSIPLLWLDADTPLPVENLYWGTIVLRRWLEPASNVPVVICW